VSLHVLCVQSLAKAEADAEEAWGKLAQESNKAHKWKAAAAAAAEAISSAQTPDASKRSHWVHAPSNEDAPR
jgi:hypothetical protein